MPTTTATPEHEHEGLSLQGLKILGIFVVLICGFLGAIAPLCFAYFAASKDDDEETRKKKHRRIQLGLKLLTCVSIGVIIATALIHVIPEGIYELEESGNSLFAREEHHEEEHEECVSNATYNCTEEEDHDEHDDHAEHDHPYPFGFLFAMVSLFTVYFVSTEIEWYGMRRLKEVKNVACDEQEEARMSALIKLYILEVGIAVHSVIIGLTLGLASSDSTARTLVIVLCVHQFFEGLAVGALTVKAEVSVLKMIGFFSLFALTTPIGIAIGVGIDGETSAVARGVVSCLAGGILLFAACCDMLPHVFGAHQHHAHGPLPLAELHNHVHGHGDNHDHDHDHSHDSHESSSPDTASPTSPAPTKEVKVSEGAVIAVEAITDAEQPEAQQQQQTEQQEKSDAKKSDALVTDTADEHQDDESFLFRFSCYCCIIVGCAIQAVLGIWA